MPVASRPAQRGTAGEATVRKTRWDGPSGPCEISTAAGGQQTLSNMGDNLLRDKLQPFSVVVT
jgi:hypothetical protein